MDTFQSFIDYGGFLPQTPGDPEKDLQLLPGEIVSSQCDNTSFYSQFGENFFGRVYCTNIRLCFVPSIHTKRSLPRRFLLFNDVFDVPLVMVHKIYYAVADASNGHTLDLSIVERRKFKELTTSVSSMDIVSALKLVLKDLRVVVFDLSKSQNAANFANHILHFSRPAGAQHVGQCGKVPGMSRRVPYADASDWSAELSRCGQKERGAWRVVYLMKEGLAKGVHSYPMHVVISADIVKHDLDLMIPNWRLGRFPIWVWAHSNGASLLRSSFPEQNENADKLNDRISLLVGRSSPNRDAPHSIRIPVEINPAQITKAFDGLRRICAIDSYSQLEAADREWLSRVHDSHWPRLVSFCLRAAGEACDWILDRRRSVIIYEEEGRDFSAVVSSLVQICLDPYCRYADGLLYLIAKEFCALGHPFGERSMSPSGTTPTLLLFLDCVHQLVMLYPIQFNYSQHLLIALWDISVTGFVPAYTCNSLNDQLAFGCTGGPSPLSSILTAEYIAMFGSVVNDAAQVIEQIRPTSSIIVEYIRPPSSIINFRFWNEFFLRWIPAANIKGGGCVLADQELDQAMDTLVKREKRATVTWTRQPKFSNSISSKKLSSAYPYSEPESAHHNPLHKSIHEAADSLSVSALSLSGFANKSRPLDADDSRSLRSKFSFKMPKKNKSPNEKFKPENMLP